MKNITRYTDEQLRRVSRMWFVKSTELQWKADKLNARLTKRLEREAKRHASIAPTRTLLSTAQVVLEALLPHGESEAVNLVRAQIVECEAKIKEFTNRYNLLNEAEIALKQMDVELAQQKATLTKAAMHEVEAELARRIKVSVAEESVEVEIIYENTLTPLVVVESNQKRIIELNDVKVDRPIPNRFLRLKNNQNSIEKGRGAPWRCFLPTFRTYGTVDL